MKYDFDNKYPLWHTHKGRVLRVNQILLGDKIVQCYPDNDGNLWYYHPNTGKATKVKEA